MHAPPRIAPGPQWSIDLIARLTAGLLVAATLGCAAAADPATPPRAAPLKPDAHASATPESSELARHLRVALADAARRTGIDAAALKVSSAERVTWLDGSLGCPEPDLLYPQVLVPGHRIRITAGTETLDYHAASRGEPLLCAPGRAVEPAGQRRSRRGRRGGVADGRAPAATRGARRPVRDARIRRRPARSTTPITERSMS